MSSVEAGWRVVQDPHYFEFQWRCRGFVFEYRFRRVSLNGYTTWYPKDTSVGALICAPTPEREAMWLDLFLRP